MKHNNNIEDTLSILIDLGTGVSSIENAVQQLVLMHKSVTGTYDHGFRHLVRIQGIRGFNKFLEPIKEVLGIDADERLTYASIIRDYDDYYDGWLSLIAVGYNETKSFIVDLNELSSLIIGKFPEEITVQSGLFVEMGSY